jgi:hypothetical protein
MFHNRLCLSYWHIPQTRNTRITRNRVVHRVANHKSCAIFSCKEQGYISMPHPLATLVIIVSWIPTTFACNDGIGFNFIDPYSYENSFAFGRRRFSITSAARSSPKVFPRCKSKNTRKVRVVILATGGMTRLKWLRRTRRTTVSTNSR